MSISDIIMWQEYKSYCKEKHLKVSNADVLLEYMGVYIRAKKSRKTE